MYCDECGEYSRTVYPGFDDAELCWECFVETGLHVCIECRNLFHHTVGYGLDIGFVCSECINLFGTCDLCGKDKRKRELSGGGVYGSCVCSECWEVKVDICSNCGYEYRINSMVENQGQYICKKCLDHFSRCDECGAYVDHSEIYDRGYDLVCSACFPYAENYFHGRFANTAGYSEIRSRRCYGLELETNACSGYTKIPALSWGNAWGAKDDGSVDAKEFYSAILDGDSGLAAIREWASFADRNDWQVGENTGFHLHIDLREASDDELYAVAYAYAKTQKVWYSLVEDHRPCSGYSQNRYWTLRDLITSHNTGTSFREWCYASPRCCWINITAIEYYETFEVRLHHGTIDGEEIINWVKAHTRFVDWAVSKGFAGVKEVLEGLNRDEMFDVIAREAWNEPYLQAYYAEKARQNGLEFDIASEYAIV